jgi:hypothetical protein
LERNVKKIQEAPLKVPIRRRSQRKKGAPTTLSFTQKQNERRGRAPTLDANDDGGSNATRLLSPSPIRFPFHFTYFTYPFYSFLFIAPFA